MSDVLLSEQFMQLHEIVIATAGICRVVTEAEIMEFLEQNKVSGDVIVTPGRTLNQLCKTYLRPDKKGFGVAYQDSEGYHGQKSRCGVPDGQSVCFVTESDGENYVNVLATSQAIMDEFMNLKVGGNSGGSKGGSTSKTYDMEDPAVVPKTLDRRYSSYTAIGSLADLDADKVKILCALKEPEKDGQTQELLPSKYRMYLKPDTDTDVPGLGIVRTYKVHVPKEAKQRFELSKKIKALAATVSEKRKVYVDVTAPFEKRIAEIREQAKLDVANVENERDSKGNVSTAKKAVDDAKAALEHAQKTFAELS